MNDRLGFYQAMQRGFITIFFGIFAGWILPALTGFGQDPTVESLLKQLGAETHAERKAAQRELQSHLPEARRQIKEFRKTETDPEILERLKEFPLERRVGVISSASRWGKDYLLVGGMASWAEQEDLQLTLIQGRRWTFTGEGPNLASKPQKEWIVDLRGQTHTPKDVAERFGKHRLGFITDKPVPGYLTVSVQAGGQMAQLVAAIREDAPGGATLAVFAGVSEAEASGLRLAAFSNAVQKTNLKIVSTPQYKNHWAELGKAGERLKKAHPDIHVLVDLDPFQHGYFHWRVARQFPKTKRYILHGNRGTLQQLMDGSVTATVADPTPRLALACLQHLVRDEGAPSGSHLIKSEPALRKKDALQYAQQLRKLELQGKVAAP